MSTHIHAYYAQVEEAKLAVIAAQGELAKAELALKEHPDYKPEEAPVKPEPAKVAARPTPGVAKV